jgi:ribosomal protein S14
MRLKDNKISDFIKPEYFLLVEIKHSNQKTFFLKEDPEMAIGALLQPNPKGKTKGRCEHCFETSELIRNCICEQVFRNLKLYLF